ncbi:MAG: hypothetical protein WCD35_06620 [Mycobacteriales bacterium]
MNRAVKIVLALLAVAALGLGGWAVFEHFDRAGIVKDSKRACGALDTPSGSSALPTGFTLPSGQKLLRVETQGKTSLVVASAEGQRGDIVKVRDAVLAELASQGYTKKGTDQEPGYEAEAELGGKTEGTLKVKPLCTDRLEVRYKLQG